MHSLKVTVAAGLAVAAFTACKPVDASQPAQPSAPAGDVVIAAGMSRSGTTEKHYVECGPDPSAEFGEYRVLVDAETGYAVRQGDPCPDGPREQMPQDKYPELFAEMSEAVNEPLTKGEL